MSALSRRDARLVAVREPEHIKAGRLAAARLTESDVKEILLKRIGYVFDWPSSGTVEGWLENVANWGGTFGEWYGWFETGARTRPYISVELKGGRSFRFSKVELFNNRTVQMALL